MMKRSGLFLLPLLLVLGARGRDAQADGKKLTIHNMSVKDERALWFAEYHTSKRGAERKGAPFKIEKRGTRSIEAAKLTVGQGRHLRWLKSNDFPQSYSSSQWERINSRKNMGTGKWVLYVSDHKSKGTYRGYYSSEWAFKSSKEFFEKYGGKVKDAVEDVVDDIATAGDPCDVINQTRETLYVGEYERKTAEAGKAQLMQGGRGAAWRVRPGETLKFTKGKLGAGYTWRWVRWQKKEGLPKTVEGRDFGDHDGWKSNSKGINKIWLGYDKQGRIKGYTTTEWKARQLVIRTAVVELIKLGRKATGSTEISIPPWLLKMLGLDRLLEAGSEAIDEVVRAALGKDPEVFLEDTIRPIVERCVAPEQWQEIAETLVNVGKHGDDILDDLIALDGSHEANMALYRKLRKRNAIPDLENREPLPRMRGSNWNPKTFVGGVSGGIVISGFARKGKGQVTVSVPVYLAGVFWRDPDTKKFQSAFSFGVGLSVSPSKSVGVKGGWSVSGAISPLFFFMDDPNNAGSHAVGISLSAGFEYFDQRLYVPQAGALDIVVPIRGGHEEGGLAVTGFGLAPNYTLGLGRSARHPKGEAGEGGKGIAFGYSWAKSFPR